MNFFDLVKESRSIRIFDRSKKISEEILREFVEIVRYTPATANRQPLKYRLVFEDGEVDAIRGVTKWGAALPDYNGPSPEESPSAYIIICQDQAISDDPHLFNRDVGIAAQTMALAACEKGIGCCMIGSFDPVKSADILSIPENVKPKLILALGYSKQKTVIEDAAEGVTYYRDNENTHHVPKRTAAELIINK